MKRLQTLHVLVALCVTVAGITLVGSLALIVLTLLQPPTQKSSELSSLLSVLPPAIIQLETNGVVVATPSSSLLMQVPRPTRSPVSFTYEFFSNTWRPRPTPTPEPLFAYDENKVQAWITQIAPLVEKAASPPGLLVTTKKDRPFAVFPGTQGVMIDRGTTIQQLKNHDFTVASRSALVLAPTGETLSPDAILYAEQRAASLSALTTVFLANDTKLTLRTVDIAPLIALPSGYNQEAITALATRWSQQVSKAPVEPQLEVNGTTVVTFVPPRDGLGIAVDETAAAITTVLANHEAGGAVKEYRLPFTALAPTKKLKDVNSLGIEERIGRGDSAYAHSIPGRIHNVALTTNRINAHIVMPGETFSFNNALGEVSARTGFQPAYVIKEGQTVLGDGGGVCQVSSTVFRAILASGLPILERKGHSYRVSYYEQNSKPGFDATVYGPKPDLRFTNDTNAPILIYAQADSKNLTMFVEFWGKSDGRTAEILNYKQWDARPAPAAVYQDDPTLPAGRIKQVDYAAPGLKTSFDYRVTYPDGTVKDQTFKTTYVPWRAVFLRGTKQ